MLPILRDELANRPAAAKSLAIFADPIFEKDDERIARIDIKADRNNADKTETAGNGETRILQHESATQAANESGALNKEFRIPRLPGTRNEATDILKLLPQPETFVALDFNANRDTVVKEDLSQYRIIHFATHGFADSVNPALSGIVLSMFDKDGKPQDGFLRAHEIFNLKIPAELVVLSACQTGLGKEVKGEGLVGLTRGLMYAGAARVVVSLWSVSDQGTSELMVKFYRKMLKERQRPSAALRAAQVEMWQEGKYRDPFFWAPFVIQGEYK